MIMASNILLNGLCSTALKGLPKGLLYQGLWSVNDQQNRFIQKHWNPKFKWLRTKKLIKVDLPNYQEKQESLSPEEIKRKFKERGVPFARPWSESPVAIPATIGIFEAYVPPEGDGKVSKLSIEGQKQTLDFLGKKSKSMLAIRKIKQYDESFSTKEFPPIAQDVYIRAHEALAAKDKEKLIDCVTEHIYPRMLTGSEDVTIRWSFIKSIEPPRVVHARQTHVVQSENLFAQITVRMHTQQTLAVYDRFGRLKHGSEIIAKDVLEYIVFEKNISSMYGEWRMHEKIIPPWAPTKNPSQITYVEEPPAEIEDKPTESSNQEDAIEAVQTGEDQPKLPPVATA